MEYKLARELRDAGFPQEGVKEPYCITCADWAKTPLICLNRKHEREFIKVPTLSELIEACTGRGRNFSLTYKKESLKWKATSYYNNVIPGFGKTPEEAVAHLYLALNKK